MDNILTKDLVEYLSDEFECSEEKVLNYYEELKRKSCVKEDIDNIKVLDCLYDILFDDSMIVCNKKLRKFGEDYFTTEDYFINKAILTHYEDKAIPDLSENYLYYVTPHNKKDNNKKKDSYTL